MNEQLAHQVLQDAMRQGVKEFCVCPGARCGPLVSLLAKEESVPKYYWFEERSAAYFALGRSRATKKPVAVITTSGTAAGELLPALMEAYYTGVPLLVITADRPRRYRCTGAPQTAEQVGIFGRYCIFEEDLEQAELSFMRLWDKRGPAHINVCFEEPLKINHGLPSFIPNDMSKEAVNFPKINKDRDIELDSFFKKCSFPLVVVSALDQDDRLPVMEFLLQLNAPVFLEGISGLREHPKIQHLRISQTQNLWKSAEECLYPIDGVLRIGGVPTFRMWRDLEDKQYKLEVCSISKVPFSGLSWGQLIHVPIRDFIQNYKMQKNYGDRSSKWLEEDKKVLSRLHELLKLETRAEASLINQISELIPEDSLVYLGNSLPIRNWDMAATIQDKKFDMHASRGVNGIDGQISTFLGLSNQKQENWAIIGDLTALYDMAGPWILKQLKHHKIRIVVINNGGGQIFANMFKEKEFLHEHHLEFEPLARMWGMEYHRFEHVPQLLKIGKHALIEVVPNSQATERFNLSF